MKTLKLLSFASMAAMTFAFAACGDEPGNNPKNNTNEEEQEEQYVDSDDVPVVSILLSQGDAVLRVGETLRLEAVYTPASTTQRNMSWVSSNPAVATISSSGLITAKAEGSVEITGTSVSNPTVKTPIHRTLVTNDAALRCETGTPGWGETLGEVSFATNQTWTIGKQIWSDAVQIDGGNGKQTYYGGGKTAEGTYEYLADYRTNPTRKGDFFSWCAVHLYGDQLCPGDWSVPTNTDYRELDKALGGTGLNQNPGAAHDKYFSDWGGEYNGWSGNQGLVMSTDSDAGYWTASARNDDYGFMMLFKINNYVGPLSNNGKAAGNALRCVKRL